MCKVLEVLGVTALVRVVLQGVFAVGLLDLVISRGGLNAEEIVVFSACWSAQTQGAIFQVTARGPLPTSIGIVH